MSAADYRSAVVQVLWCARVVAQHDLPKLLRDIAHAHAVGPVLDPTLYRDKARAMDEDAEMLKAALPLYELGKALEERAKANGLIASIPEISRG